MLVLSSVAQHVLTFVEEFTWPAGRVLHGLNQTYEFLVFGSTYVTSISHSRFAMFREGATEMISPDLVVPCHVPCNVNRRDLLSEYIYLIPDHP